MRKVECLADDEQTLSHPFSLVGCRDEQISFLPSNLQILQLFKDRAVRQD